MYSGKSKLFIDPRMQVDGGMVGCGSGNKPGQMMEGAAQHTRSLDITLLVMGVVVGCGELCCFAKRRGRAR